MSDLSEPRYPWILLRVIVGLPFIAAGLFSAIHWNASVAFNAELTGPALAPAFTALAVSQILGGLSLVTGYKARLGAVLLLAFLLPASVRHLWIAQHVAGFGVGDAELVTLATRGQLASLEKNIGLIGVMVFVIIRGVGPARNKPPG